MVVLKKILLVVLLLVCQIQFGQGLVLQITAEHKTELAVIDSLGYQQKHRNAKSVLDEAQKFSTRLLEIGYLEQELVSSGKVNDTLYVYTFRLGEITRLLYINMMQAGKFLKVEQDTLELPIQKTSIFLQEKLDELEREGFSLSTAQLVNFKKYQGKLYATLKINPQKKRILDAIVITGYDKFPSGHRKQMERQYVKKTFTKNRLENLFNDFTNFRFVTQARYPEILFTTDSTKAFVYVEKSKSNRFDGYIGFANNEAGTVDFTGYLDIALVNILNSGEDFNLYWKGDDNDQVTFNAQIELPYVFKSRLGAKANLNIFKQDSTFQNTKTALDLGYYFTYNKKLFVGYQSIESSDIQNTNSGLLRDFESRFLTTSFDYRNFTDDALFPERTRFAFKAGVGTRTSAFDEQAQRFIELNFSHNIYLNPTNIVHVQSQNFYLNSDAIISNELYRFGGIQSIRGFNENSLQASTLFSLLSEYRYILSSSLYVHSVLDYGFYEDNTTKSKNNLLGLGFGAGIKTKNGLLNIIYANGSSGNQSIKLTNSVVQLKFVTFF